MKRFLLLTIIFSLSLFAVETSLSKDELKSLKKDGYIIKKDKIKKTGFISFDINRDIDAVYSDIINLSKYPLKIEDVSKVDIYSQSGRIVKATIYIDTFLIDFHNSIVHFIDKNNYTVKWHLDNKYEDNYFSKMDGYWFLKRVDNKTRIFYANDLGFKGWVPSFLEDYLFEKGLKESTFWLKESNE